MAVTTTQIRCDHDGCPATVLRLNETLRQARARHRRTGWTYTSGHPTTGPGRDLCPLHSRLRAAKG